MSSTAEQLAAAAGAHTAAAQQMQALLGAFDTAASTTDVGVARFATAAEAAARDRADLMVSPATLSAELRRGRTFPEVLTPNGRLTVSAGAGEVIIASEQIFLWRGTAEINTSSFSAPQRTFAVVANKTFHLRWHPSGVGLAVPAATWPNGRFVLRDLADAAYNPTSQEEGSTVFDGTFDDMLIARVTTNPTNVVSITTLTNRAVMQDVVAGTSVPPITNAAANDSQYVWTNQINWSRRPIIAPIPAAMTSNGAMGNDSDFLIEVQSSTRYVHQIRMIYDFVDTLSYYAMLRA